MEGSGTGAPVRRRRHVFTPLTEFLRTESAGGIVLLAATVVALVWANVWPEAYDDLWHERLVVGIGDFSIDEDLRAWVNDALMAVFFFVVGLEIKRELVVGELRDPRAVAVPALAALGGMVVPALIFFTWTAGTDASRGWGIPMATDIAFAVGVLTIIGRRAPSPLKLFLLTLAIVDDIGAIAVIAIFYTEELHAGWLVGAFAAVAVILVMQRLRVSPPAAYVIPGIALWVAILESGVHATIAGVTLGLLTPAVWPHGREPLVRLEHIFHPVASFGVIPVFALANAGVAVGLGDLGDALGSRVTWGVLTGLVVGKLVGVAGATFLAVRLGAGRLPAGATRRHLAGTAAIAGIGFTVSLFISELSFRGGTGFLDDAKIGVLLASITSGTLGAAILAGARRPRASEVG